MKRGITILCILLKAICVMGGEVPVGMTLKDCLLYAREHAYGNRISRVHNSQSEVNVRLTASSLMPSMSFSTGGNISFGRNIDPETNTYDTRKTISNSYGIYLSLPVFDGLVGINNLKVAKVSRERQRYATQEEEDKRSLELIRSFYNVTYVRNLVEQMHSQLLRDSMIYSGVCHEYELGMKSGADVQEINAVLMSDEYELTNQRNNLKKAYSSLKGNLGMPLDSPDPLLIETDFRLEKDGSNLRIEMARLDWEESRIRLRMAKGAFSPVLNLNGGFSTSFYRLLGEQGFSPGFGRQLRDNMGEYIGASISIPIFNGFSRINSLKKAKLNELESRLMLEQTIYEAEREKEDAKLDLSASIEELTASERRLEAEETAYSAIKRKFELGDASGIDLFTAGARLASAKATHEGKRIQKILAEILLAYYHGARLIE